MAVNKNFTVRNGLEVNTKLILADANTNKVGIGSTAPRFELDVAGGIGATDMYVLGISTVREIFNVGAGGKVLSVIAGAGGISTSKVGIGTSNPEFLLEVRSPVSTGQTALYVYGDLKVTGDLSIDDINLDQSNVNRLYVSQNLDVTGAGSLLVQSGVSTFGGYVDINSNADISGTVNIGGITTITNTTESTNFNQGALVIDGGLGVEKSVNIGGQLNVVGNSVFNGNLSVAGTFFAVSSQDVLIANRDLILGFTTESPPNDNTANHGGIAIASTEGGFLVPFSASGINTLPDTYKQFMWFKSGTLGFATDMFALNYGLAIGTTSVGYGTRLAVGSGVSFTDTALNIVSVNTQNLNATGVSTLGNVKISSGIITATSPSGIVTYYGDGSELLGVIGGIGIGTTGGLVGYGITFLNLFGAGVSTTFYEPSVGIATIFFEGGGGGGGSISISTVAPTSPNAGDLWYSPVYARTFIYYDEVEVGYGTDSYWIDAAPFNAGINATLAGVAFSAASAISPSLYFAGDVQTGFFSPTPGQFTVVSTGSSILNINSTGVRVTGVVTATNFVGNGSGLTGISSVSFATTAFGLTGNPNINVGTIIGSAATFTNLTVNGTQTIINTTSLEITDKTVGIASTSTPSDALADGAGIVVYGDTNKTLLYDNTRKGWDFNIPLTTDEVRFYNVAEKLTRIDGNTVNLVYSANGSNIGLATNPSGDITLNVTGIPTDSSFDNHVITFSVFVTNTGTARTVTAVNLNGVSETINWAGGSLSAAISGVTTSTGIDIYSFTGINTIGSASTAANYRVLGVANGGYR